MLQSNRMRNSLLCAPLLARECTADACQMAKVVIDMTVMQFSYGPNRYETVIFATGAHRRMRRFTNGHCWAPRTVGVQCALRKLGVFRHKQNWIWASEMMLLLWKCLTTCLSLMLLSSYWRVYIWHVSVKCKHFADHSGNFQLQPNTQMNMSNRH